MTASATEITPTTPADQELLGNLVELYVHDLSAIFQHVEIGANGRFGYPSLDRYLNGANGKMAFLIRHEGRTAGFILAKQGSPLSDDPEVLDVAEFFVLRRYRGQGVGRDAAEQLWSRLRGKWMVRAAVKNPEAVAFWRRVITTYTDDAAEESDRSTPSGDWTVFTFDTTQRA